MSESLMPWGLTRMRPYPEETVLLAAEIVLDPVTQTGRWIGMADESGLLTARHKRSETNKETRTRTSPDGAPDQGSDQEGDTD
jgi:putative ATP-grasp target RiPP